MFTIEEHEGIHVLRDDLLLGGTKSRYIDAILSSVSANEIVYPANSYGIAMVAIADALKSSSKNVTFFLMDDDSENNLIIQKSLSLNKNITIKRVKCSAYSAVIEAAKKYSDDSKDRHMIPPGFNTEIAVAGISQLCESIIEKFGTFDAAFSVYGSGTVQRGMQHGKLAKSYYAINTLYEDQTARDVGEATIIQHYLKEAIDKSAYYQPPFPTFPAYDAKAWVYAKNYIRINSSHKVLFWNVACLPE